MTHRLYFSSDALTANVEVLQCIACEEGFAVILNATPFHPQGGGQPSDTGSIGESQVLRVTQEFEHIVHYTAHPVLPGAALARVDPAQRALHARLHSAGHLIGLAGENLGWRPTKAHHWPGESRVSFVRGEQPENLDAATLHCALEQWIAADLHRNITLDADQRHVSFGTLAAYPCGGTHVRSLAEIGTVEVLSISEKKGTIAVNYRVN